MFWRAKYAIQHVYSDMYIATHAIQVCRDIRYETFYLSLEHVLEGKIRFTTRIQQYVYSNTRYSGT